MCRGPCLDMRKTTFWLVLAAVLTATGSAIAGVYPARNGEATARIVNVYSSLDEDISGPLIAAFQAANPDLAVRYEELQTVDVFDRIIKETDAGGVTGDVAISSGMDLQMKLANDGYAQPVTAPSAFALPDWARWRDTAFALTFEPAVIVYNKRQFADVAPPTTHGELIRFLANSGDAFYGRIGTYDVERSGLGFLFFARDLEHYRDIWDLVRAMGKSGVKLYSTSSAILERVADGRFALGYNILGSYALGWAERAPDLGIILPADYTVVMSRIGLVPKAAASPDLGARFLDFLMSSAGQTVLAHDMHLPAILPGVESDNMLSGMQNGGQSRIIPVSPGLLVYLDQVKRAALVRRWNAALRGQ
jgi:iron(III) transport system substrate-binding protein